MPLPSFQLIAGRAWSYSSDTGPGRSLAKHQPVDGQPEGFSDGAVDDEVDGAVEDEEEIDEVDEDEESGGEVQPILGQTIVVVILGALLRVQGLEKKQLGNGGRD